ncbi:MAG: hypothetical protein R3E53_06715 [Myxococcota bacterium]
MKLELARVERLNLGLSAGAVAASLALETPHFATSLAAGALLEAINLGAIHRGAKRFFSGEIAGARGWIGVFSLRFLVLATAIFLTMHAGANPAALLIGLSIVMPATLIDAWLNRPPVVDPATLPTFLDGAPSPASPRRTPPTGRATASGAPAGCSRPSVIDLIAEEATRVAAEEKAHWARLEAARKEANARHSRANLPEEMPEDGSDEAR